MKLDVMPVSAGATGNIILMLFKLNHAPLRTLRTQSQGDIICDLCGELNNEKQPPIFSSAILLPLSSSLWPGARPDLTPPSLVVRGVAGAF